MEVDGSGYGYGDGSGDGDGYGYGDGSGYGDGYGSGDGSGDGDGYGSGDGYETILAEAFSGHPLLRDRIEPTVLALWRSDADGKPVNGGSGPAVSPGLVQEVSGPLQICTANALHGTTTPWNWKGDRWWVVALFEPVQRQDDKIASLKRLIVAELV